MRTIRLPHAIVELHDFGAVTFFLDGTHVEATPMPELDSYREQAADLGYGIDLLSMCRDHEVLHSVAAELLHGKPSEVLWRVAHGDPRRKGLTAEEQMVLRLQRELRRVT